MTIKERVIILKLMDESKDSTLNRSEIKDNLTEGSIWKKILLFAIPIMLSNMFTQFYTAVDSAVVGTYIGYEALAAVGANSALINVLLCLFLGIGVGGGVIVAQYYGAKDSENVSKATHTIMLFAFISGIFLTAIGFFFAKPILMLINTPADVLELSTDYLKVYFVGVLAVVIYNIGAGILRATGNSLMPFIYLLAGSLLNIGLDLWFVAGLGYGIVGAAWATVISNAVSAICVIIHLFVVKGPHRLTLKRLKFDKVILGKVFKIGLPVGIQTSMYSIANLLIQVSLNGYGSLVMAGWVAANKIDVFAFAPVSAFGSAVNTFAGQNYGAKNYDRVKKGMYRTILMAEITSCVMAVPLLLFANQVLSLFNTNPQVIEYGRQIMFMVIPIYTVFGLAEVLSGTLRGIGRTVVSAIISFSGILVVRIIWLYLVLPHFNTPFMLFFVHPISWIITALMFGLYFVIMKWNRIFKTDSKEVSVETVAVGIGNTQLK